jgi:glutaminyl-peptide cyclotransferase
LIDLAKRLDPLLPKLRAGWGVIVVFFDGEEAFGDWSATDSLYGARHLATEWSQEADGKASKLSRIHTFLLLDLIGASNPSFQNVYSDVQPAFERLISIESRLKKSSLCVFPDRVHFPAPFKV